jgi:hypothetical protein
MMVTALLITAAATHRDQEPAHGWELAAFGALMTVGVLIQVPYIRSRIARDDEKSGQYRFSLGIGVFMAVAGVLMVVAGVAGAL